MITANNRLYKAIRTVIGAACMGSIAALSGCSSNTLHITQDFKETPEISQTNMTGAIGCMASSLQKTGSDNAYVFLVRDINDGTVKEGPYQDGPLSDAGRIQMLNVLSDHLYPISLYTSLQATVK